MRATLSELGASLSRNKSMTISLVVTMTVSLLLVALGLLIHGQVDRTEKYFGDRLQLQVNLCTKNSPSSNCIGGVATDDQKTAVRRRFATTPRSRRSNPHACRELQRRATCSARPTPARRSSRRSARTRSPSRTS